MPSVVEERVTMNVSEAAAYLGVGRQTVYDLVARGQLPGARRLGRRIVVVRKVLDAFLAGETANSE